MDKRRVGTKNRPSGAEWHKAIPYEMMITHAEWCEAVPYRKMITHAERCKTVPYGRVGIMIRGQE